MRKVYKSGFLLIEIIFAMALWALIFPAIISLWFSIYIKPISLDVPLTQVQTAFTTSSVIATTTNFERNLRIEEVQLQHFFYKKPLTYIAADITQAFGIKSCMDLNVPTIEEVVPNKYMILPGGNKSSALEVRNGYVYMTTNSATATDSDFVVIDTKNIYTPAILNVLDTGPGLSSIHLAGFTAYVGNLSVKNQLQAIDISIPSEPKLVWSYKINGANSSTSPLAKSLTYYKGSIFLGTEKTSLAELYRIDVSSTSPKEVAQYEIGAGVNDIYAADDKLYVGTPLNPEVQIFDITGSSIKPFTTYDAPGGSGNGKRLDVFNNEIFLGRTVGGEELSALINNSSTTITAQATAKIKASIDGMIVSKDYIYLLTSDPLKELQIWKKEFDSSDRISNFTFVQGIDLPYRGTGIDCDGPYLYVSMDNKDALRIFKEKNE